MGKFNCAICGKEFDRVGNGIYCPGPHYRPCPVCGKPVEFHSPKDPVRCCSKECVKELSRRSRSRNLGVKKCEECGKVFTPSQPNQRYCSGPHHTKCLICGKDIEYVCSPREKPNYCSQACVNEGHRRTVQERYGVDNVSELDWVRNKISEVNGSEAVKRKRANTCLNRYGVTNPMYVSEVAKKVDDFVHSKEFIERSKQTSLERYGVESPMQSEEVKDRRNQTNLLRYGCLRRPPDASEMSKKMIDGSKVDSYLSFKSDPGRYIEEHFDHSPSIRELEIDLGVTNTPIYDILVKNNCSYLLNSLSSSSMEVDVSDAIRSIDPDISIDLHNRNMIHPYELDIFLPEYNIAIECNPAATHNSSKQDPWGGPPKHYKYHQYKSDLARDNGIFLFHIFGYEWINKRPIIVSMLRNLLGKNVENIGGRETYIDVISNYECSRFLDENHRQGSVNASIRLGLRHKQTKDLVSVMTFNKLRNTVGRGKLSEESDWELSRFCSKLNTTVHGAASKLFKYFTSNYTFREIVSFSDVAHTQGTLYKLLGFENAHRTTPSYVWSTVDDQIYYHRVACQKRNLKKLLNDCNLDLSKTERDLMESRNFVRVYDCGVIKWVKRSL